MSRPLRIEYPRACYHIMNRGNQRMDVFSSAGDRNIGVVSALLTYKMEGTMLFITIIM